MPSDLLPCPFCGGPAERVDIEDGENAGGSCICCTRCNASSNVEFGFKENYVSNWNRRAPDTAAEARGRESVTVPNAAKVLLDACPNPIFDDLKPVMMGEFHQTYPFFDENGEEVTAKVNVSWTVTKDIIKSALRALAGETQR